MNDVLRRRAVLGTLAAAVAALAVACMGPTFVVQQYDGAPRPGETIAILRVDAKEPARLLVLDGEDIRAPLIEDARLHIEILPGPHTVVVGNTNAPHERYSPMSFEAAPGKVYRVVFPLGATGEAKMFEVEKGSNRLLRDVTGAPKVAPAPPPAMDASMPSTSPESSPDSGTDAGSD